MHDVLREVRHALRSLRRTPAFAAIAIVSLTLAIGANTAVVTLLSGLVWREAAVRDPHSLVQLSTVNQSGSEGGLSWLAFRELRRREDLFQATIGWVWSGGHLTNVGTELTEAALAGVSGEFYSELGVVPAAGRLIAPTDVDIERDVSSPVVVIGWTFWQRVFGGSPSAVGQQIRVEGVPLTIIGVAPRGFTGLAIYREPEITVPLGLIPQISGGSSMKQGGPRWIDVTGRLRPSVTIDDVRARLEAAWPSILQSTMPPTFAGAQRDAFMKNRLLIASAANGVDRMLRPRYTRALFIVLAIATVIAVITAINLCGLAYARAGARAFELRVRLALGAGRARLLRTAAIEGVLIGAASAVLSVWLAKWIGELVLGLITANFTVPVLFAVAPDGRAMTFAAVMSVSIGVLMAVAPAWTIARDGVEPTILPSTRTVARSGRAGRLLLTAQVALSIVLLIGSALLVRSLYKIASTDVGLRTSDVFIGYPNSKTGAYRDVDPEAYYQQTLMRVEGVPGVEAAAFALFKPAGGAPTPDRVGRSANAEGMADVPSMQAQVSPGFFHALGIPVLRGRAFSWGDDLHGRRVAILSESVATRLFGPGGGVGEIVRVGARPELQNLEVVGIVGDARLFDVRIPNLATVYVPALQMGKDANWKALVVRAPASTIREVQNVVDDIGVEFILRMESFDEVTNQTVMTERLTAVLAAYFGGLALVLAAIGIHGQMSYLVSMQRKEIGVRMALGADAQRILRWIVGNGAAIGIAGGLIGLVLSVPAVGVLRSLLVEMSPYDPVAFSVAPALLLAAIVGACLVPALRAVMIDPVVELRRD